MKRTIIDVKRQLPWDEQYLIYNQPAGKKDYKGNIHLTPIEIIVHGKSS